MKVRKFQGYLPRQDEVQQIASLPYDVINTKEARQLADGNPLSYFHVIRAEIDLPDGADIYSQEAYDKAKENIEKLIEDGHFVKEEKPSLYIYRQIMGSHSQTGIVGTCHYEDYLNNIIKKHEKTRIDKENDRLRLAMTLQKNLEPVFLLYKDSASINDIISNTQKQEPRFDFTSEDGIKHTLWNLSDEDATMVEQAFAKIPVSYVADGHHRSASAARAGLEMKKNNPNHTGEENYNYYLAVLFSDKALQILPYNRAVHTLNSNTKEQFMEKLEKVCVVTKADAHPSKSGECSMYLDGTWYKIEFKQKDFQDPVSALDVSILQDYVLKPILGIEDPRTSKDIDFVGGIRGVKELEKLVDTKKAAVAFSMFPTTVDQLISIADADQIMPPKSTWFEPKLRSGLFLHSF